MFFCGLVHCKLSFVRLWVLYFWFIQRTHGSW